jgi:murein DD-endopeptidase MepM/ murein hydrolase activator NlpD
MKFLTCLFLLLLVDSAHAATDWIKPVLSKVENTSEHTTEIWFQAPKEFPVTVDYHLLTCTGCETSAPASFKVFIEKGQKQKVASIKPDGTGKFEFTHAFHFIPGKENPTVPAATVYALPFAKGDKVLLGQGYHGAVSHFPPNEFSLDFMLAEGSEVHAAREGTVVFVEQSFELGGFEERFKKLANVIIVLHDDFTIAIYAHLKKDGAVVKVGDSVTAGQLIGYSGKTGYLKNPHLHLEIGYYLDCDMKIKSIPTKFKVNSLVEDLKQGQSYSASL